METIQVAAAILTVMTSLCGLVAVSTDYWLVNENDTESAGLFNSCKRVQCKSKVTGKEKMIKKVRRKRLLFFFTFRKKDKKQKLKTILSLTS